MSDRSSISNRRLSADDVIVSMDGGVVNGGCTLQAYHSHGGGLNGYANGGGLNGHAPVCGSAGEGGVESASPAPNKTIRYSQYRASNGVSRQMSESDGATLVFKNVCVTLAKKPILKNICGMAKVGQTLAIMGPSGAGKSTLLNTLGGRVPATSGSITLNGQPVKRHMRRKISYVQQQDVFYSHLTLRESLTFTACLRLPDAMSKELKLRRMHEIVDVLELTKCLDTIIGGLFVTGLSGGERKRASIACELLTNPRIIILDEPTSGLDSAIAYSLMSTLSKYASQSHKTVVTTIHQPSSQIFHMFTNVLLVTEGEVAYFGPGNRIINFFADLGFHCDSLYNPADFILEQVKSGPDNVKRIVAGAEALRLTDAWPEELKDSVSMYVTKEDMQRHSLDDTLSSRGSHKRHTNSELSSLANDREVDVDGYVVEGATWQTSFLSQYATLTRRGFLHASKRLSSKIYIGQIIIISVIAGLEWFQTDRTEFRAKDRLGILYFTCVHLGFIPIMEGIFRIYDADGVFIRERSSGIFRLSSAFMAIMTSEIPVMAMMVTSYAIVIYWMTGLMPAAGNFFGYLGVLLLSAFTAQSMGLFVGSVVLNKAFVVPIGNTMMITFLLVGGFYNTNVAVWFNWFRYLSYLSYSFSAMAHIEFAYGAPLRCNPLDTTTFPEYCHFENSTLPGSAFLHQQNLDTVPLFANILVLVGLIISFRVATYIALRFTRVKT